MPIVVPGNRDEEQLKSARKLGVSKYLDDIEKYPLPAGQASPNARGNIEGIASDDRFNPPDIDIAPPGSPPAKASDPAWLNEIPAATPPGAPPAAAGATDFLSEIPAAQTNTQQAYEAAKDTDPDHNAKVIKYSEQFGQPPEFIDANIKQAEKAAAAPGPDAFEVMERDYPGSTRFYSKPDNMAVAHDDMENVAGHEQLVQHASIAHGVLSALGAGFQESLLGRTVRARAPETSLAPDASMLDSLAYQAGSFVNPLDLGVMAIGGILGEAAGLASAPLTGPVGPIVGSGAGAFGLHTLIKKLISEQQEKGDVKGLRDTFDRLYTVAKETGKSGVVGGITSLSGASAAGIFPGSSLAAEITAMELSGKAVEDQPITAKGVAEAALMVGGLHVAGAGGAHLLTKESKIESSFQQAVQEEKVTQAKNFYEALGDTAEASKLRERLPDRHLELVRDLTKDGPVKDVYIPLEAANSYFQKAGLPIDRVMEQLGAKSSLEEARATGGDIKIPLATWAKNFVGTEHWKGLADDVKFSPEGLTPREHNERVAETSGQTQAVADQAGAQETANPEEKPSAGALRIFQNMSEKLKAAGLSANEVRYDSQVHTSILSTLADRINQDLPPEQHVTAEDLHQRIPLEIRRFNSLAERDAANQSFQFGANDSNAPAERATGTGVRSNGDAALLREVSQGAKKDRLALAKKALENIPDVSADAVAEAFGLKKEEVRLLGWKGRRKGKAVETNYSKDDILRAAGQDPSAVEAVKSFDQGPNSNVLDFVRKAEKQPKEVPADIEKPEQNAKFNESVVDATKLFPANERTGKQEFDSQKMLDSLEARFPERSKDGKEAAKAIKRGQDPEQGPYVTDDKMPGIGWVPNYAAEPTGELGPRHIAEPNSKYGKETDPFKWADDKYHATQRLLEKYSEQGKVAVINTSSDLIARDGYIDKIPAGSKINMYMLSKQDGWEGINRQLFPGNPSRLRQEKAALELRKAGFTVNKIEPTRESLIEAAGGRRESAKKLGVKLTELNDTIDRGMGPRLIQLNQDGSYRNVPDALMGFSADAAKQRGFDDQNYKHIQYVEVKQPDGTSHVDAIKGLNEAHALERANRNWEGSAIELLTEDQARAKDPDAVAFFQGDENNPRGQITFGGRKLNVIDLFSGKDPSTPIHELGHFYLEVLGHVVEGEGKGSKSLKEDYASVLKWMGVNSREEITPEMHEKWARGFEQYLATGDAPSLALRDAFANFRRWLTKLWRKVSFEKVEISPEIRGVFDRLLATEDQINEAKKSLNMAEEFADEGLDQLTKDDLQKMQEQARNQVEDHLLKEQLKTTQAEYRAKLDEETAKFRGAAEEQVKQEPIFQAIESLREEKGQPYALAEKALRNELTPEQSVKFDLLADEHGFATAQELAQAVIDARDSGLFESKVQGHVNDALRGIGMLKDRGQLREEAIRAIHDEKMTELLAMEREALLELAHKKEITDEARKRNRAIAKVDAQAASAEAARIISQKPAMEAGRVAPFITQERNAAARVAKFLAKKDFEKAAQAKKEQMIAHSLVRESFKASEEAAVHFRYIEQFKNRGGDLLGMPYGFVRQLDQLLTRFSFQPARSEDAKTMQAMALKMADEGESFEDIANATGLIWNKRDQLVPESLPEFLARQEDQYHPLNVSEAVASAMGGHPETLTMAELKDLRESVQSIAVNGRKNGRFLNEFIQVDIKEAAAKFRARAAETIGEKYAGDALPGSAHATKIGELLESITRFPDVLDRTLDTMYTTCDKFDGLEEGPAKDFIYRPMADAQARAITRTKKTVVELEAIFAKHYGMDEFAKYKDERINIDGRTLTKEQILSMALNWGNLGNRDRILRGFGYDHATIKRVFANLGAKDWNFAQDVWDHIDQFWPDIARLEMSVNGSEPGKVQPAEFVNEHGKFRGGYYPIAYDFEKSADAFQNNLSKDALFKSYSTAKAATEQGHAAARVANVKRQIRLSLDVLTSHYEDVIHDIEFRKAVIDVNRFLNQKDTKAAIVNATGVKGYAGFQDWLKNVAGGSSEPMTGWDKAAQWFRFKTVFYNMGWRIGTAPKIGIENVVNLSSEIGASGAARALKNYWMDRSGMHELVVSKSPFMRQRGEHLNQDISDITDKYRNTEQSGLKKYAFYTHAYLDQAVSFPLWADTYRRGIAEHGKEKLAISQADEAVKRTFMSGGSVDQPAAMRGTETKKAFTTAYGYQSMMWNRFSRARFAAGMEWADGNRFDATMIMAKASLYTFIMPAIVGTLTAELLRNGPSGSDEEQKKRMAEHALQEANPLKFIPYVRDLTSYAIRKGMGEHTSGLQLTPIAEAAQSLIDPIFEKHSVNSFEHKAQAVSLLAGFPRQANDMVFNFLDWQQHNGGATWKNALGVQRMHKK